MILGQNYETGASMRRITPAKVIWWAILGVLLLIIFLVARWLFTTGNIELRFTGEQEDRTVHIVRQSDGETIKTVTTRENTLTTRLPSGDYEVRLSANYEQKGSTYLTSVPRFLGTATTEATISNQFVRNRVGDKLNPCAIYTTTDLYSYGCPGSVGNLVWHKPLSKTTDAKLITNPFTEEAEILAVEPYKDNVLVLVKYEDAPNPLLLLIKQDGQVDELILPESFTSARNIFLLRTDIMGGDRFIVMRGDAEEVLTFSNFKAKPKSFSPDIAKYRRDGIGFSVDLADSSILFANGHTSISPDTPRSVKESGGKSGGDMIIYNADSGEESKKPFGVDGYVDSAGFCKKDYICQLDDQTLHIIDTTGSPKEVDRINNVLDFVSMNGTKLAYLQNGQVYVTDITSGFTQLAYRTNNFTISDLHRATSGVLLAGTQKNSGLNSISSAFLLEDEPAKTNVFVDEKIPYPIGAYGFVRSFDYQNKIIRVSIQTARSAAFGSASGGADYNTTEYTQSRSKLLKQLQADGINLDEYMVITKPFAF